jgi:hypothetical protein
LSAFVCVTFAKLLASLRHRQSRPFRTLPRLRTNQRAVGRRRCTKNTSATSRPPESGFAEAQSWCDAASIPLTNRNLQTVTPPELCLSFTEITRLTPLPIQTRAGPDHQFVEHKQRPPQPRPQPPFGSFLRSPIFPPHVSASPFSGQRPYARGHYDLQIDIDVRHRV